jgi:hypothetical protein
VKKFSPYYKAAAGFLAAALVAYLGATDGGVTSQEWLTIVLAGLGGSGLVYVVPNKDPLAKHQRESVQPPQAGRVALGLVVVVTILGAVLLLLAPAANANRDTNWPCAGCVTTHR